MKIKGIIGVLCVAATTGWAQKQEPNPMSTDFVASMQLVFQDEFNDQRLDTTKWSTQYYSTFDLVAKTNYADFRANTLPEPAFSFTDSSIMLYTDTQYPERPYWPQSGRKISSIQTYDWNTNTNKLGGEFVGGYIEARIKRSATPDAKMVNGAFWLDSPGPDLKYYMNQGHRAFGAQGVRPVGQLFEIDLCENLNTEIVLHGNVGPKGAYLGNMGHAIIKGNYTDRWVVHGMLWSAQGLIFFVDGKEIARWWDPKNIKSPDHYMNIFLGMYGKDGRAAMEVDYVRFYQWQTERGNLLANGGFAYAELFPWQGTGQVHQQALVLNPGQRVEQYLYLEADAPHTLSLEAKGAEGSIEVVVEQLEPVSGKTIQKQRLHHTTLTELFTPYELSFRTRAMKHNHQRTVRVSIENLSNAKITIDQVAIRNNTKNQ